MCIMIVKQHMPAPLPSLSWAASLATKWNSLNETTYWILTDGRQHRVTSGMELITANKRTHKTPILFLCRGKPHMAARRMHLQ